MENYNWFLCVTLASCHFTKDINHSKILFSTILELYISYLWKITVSVLVFHSFCCYSFFLPYYTTSDWWAVVNSYSLLISDVGGNIQSFTMKCDVLLPAGFGRWEVSIHVWKVSVSFLKVVTLWKCYNIGMNTRVRPTAFEFWIGFLVTAKPGSFWATWLLFCVTCIE